MGGGYRIVGFIGVIGFMGFVVGFMGGSKGLRWQMLGTGYRSGRPDAGFLLGVWSALRGMTLFNQCLGFRV